MDVNRDWEAEFKEVYPNARYVLEGGYAYFLIPEMKAPRGCKPEKIAALLCLSPKDGYDSRLYLSDHLEGAPARNWNSNMYVFDRNWHAVSWKSTPGLSYLEMMMINLKAFNND